MKSGVRSPTAHRTLEQAQAHSTSNLSESDKAKNRRRTKDRRDAIKDGRVSRNDGKDLHHPKGEARGRTVVQSPGKNRANRGRKNGRSSRGS